jgi:superfamily I DNA/RNA helicase
MLPGMTNTTRTWSQQQTAIFDFFATGRGNLVVRARAGTGKTTTIIEAVKHAPQDKILLAAFNKRIATELTNRIGSTPNVEAKTLHSLGFAFIRRQWKDVKVDATVDADRARVACGGKNAPDEMVVMVKKLAGLLKSVLPFGADIDAVIPIAEMFDCVPDTEWEQEGWDIERICSLAIKARDAAKERDEHGRISFDDMVYIPLANGFARPWFTMVVVDEAQDMNYAQLLLAQSACKRIGRIVVVGDDAQAIYGFRGADADSLDRLKTELNARELGLTVTYRCGKKIVDLAAKMVPDFRAHDDNADGTIDGTDPEALLLAAKPGDFVLSRKNAPLMPLCLSFLKRGVRARIEGRDVGAGLRAIVIKFKARSVPQFIERVQGWAAKQTVRAEKLTNEDAREAKLGQIADQAEMLTALAEGCVSVEEILQRTETLFGDSEGAPPAVVLSSVHKAKGLEADRVFILANTFRASSREEKNICYVAYTRAKTQLTWVVEKKA